LVNIGKVRRRSWESWKILSNSVKSTILLSCKSISIFFQLFFIKSSMLNQEWNILYHNCYQSTRHQWTSLKSTKIWHISFTITLPNKKKIKNRNLFEKNQRFLLSFGALSPNLFLENSENSQWIFQKHWKCSSWVASEGDITRYFWKLNYKWFLWF
jgi:hypothetical protein